MKTESTIPILDIPDFNNRILASYNDGTAEYGLDADISVSRSLVPAGTGAFRDFSYIAPDIPVFDADACVGCMECVTECPDTAILAKAIPTNVLDENFKQKFDKRYHWKPPWRHRKAAI